MNTIQEGWDDYSDKILSKVMDLTKDQKNGAKIVFYSGSFWALNVLHKILKTNPSQEAFRALFLSLMNECFMAVEEARKVEMEINNERSRKV